MDETFNTTMVDSSGNGNDGTTYDVGTAADQGYLFNGSSSKVVVPDSPTLNPGSRNFSYTVQVLTTVVPGTGMDYDLMRKGISATQGGEFKVEIINNSGRAKALCLLKDTSGKSLQLLGTTNLADGVLHTIMCAKTAAGITLKVDSLAKRKKSGALGSVSNTVDLVIGAKKSTGTDATNDWYNGTMRSASVSVDTTP